MSPREFLDVADELATGNREGDWRSAASRAYYAAFHVARQLLRQSGFAVPQADRAHSYLWLRLANAGHPDVQRAGNDLSDMRVVRNQADYDLDNPFLQQDGLDQVHQALRVVQVLEALPAVPAVLAQVIGAIRVYERDVLGQVTWQP
jgi:uncharacterized protein (UPF0332 family)